MRVRKAFPLPARTARWTREKRILEGSWTPWAYRPAWSLLPMDLLLFKELHVVSSTGSPLLWSTAMRLIERGLLKVDPLITHRFELADAVDALACIHRDRGQVIKAEFQMGGAI